MVIGLTATLIVGVIVAVGALVTRLPGRIAPAPMLPNAIKLPEGVKPEAVTFGRGWYAVVTGDQRILIYDAESGALRQEVKVAQ